MISLGKAVNTIQNFETDSLTDKISDIEIMLEGNNKAFCVSSFSEFGVTPLLLDSAIELKQIAAQINVLIHAVGILLSLPHILTKDETIEALSLGAGNTGKPFDLETNQRVAEFKFINWKGGAEAIRQNSLFKDFYSLAEHETHKERYLYVIGTKYPLKFFKGRRAIKSVLSKNIKLQEEFSQNYGNRFERVFEYYSYRKEQVKLVDISKIIPQFSGE